MTIFRMRSIVVNGVLAAALWCALFGSVNALNVLGGFGVGALIALTFPIVAADQPHRGGVRLRPLKTLAYVGHFSVALVLSAVEVSLQLLWSRDRFRSAIIKVVLPQSRPAAVDLVAYTITMTPGTMVVDLDYDDGALWIHTLHMDDDGADLTAETLVWYERANAALGFDTMKSEGTS